MSNVPGPQFGLNQIIDAFTQVVAEKKAQEQRFSPIRPSSSGKCERELGYELMEYRGFATYPKEATPSHVHRLLNFGHQIERHVIDEMYKAFQQSPTPIAIRYKQQVLSFFPLPDGTWLEGSMDLAIEGPDWKMVCDIKSKGDKYSQFYKSSWDEFVEKLVSTGFAVKFGDDAVYITDLRQFLEVHDDAFFNNNLYQLNFYACNPFLKERGYNLASIIQLNKNDSRLREVRFTPDQEVYEKVKHKFIKVVNEVDQNKSVDGLNRDFALGTAKCGFCPFRKQCWPEDDALKAYFKTWPPKQWAKDFDRLPAEVQAELKPLFDEYHSLTNTQDRLEKIERNLANLLYKYGLFKVRLNDSQIYRVKRLKSGGVGGGERLVLRRDKA